MSRAAKKSRKIFLLLAVSTSHVNSAKFPEPSLQFACSQKRHHCNSVRLFANPFKLFRSTLMRLNALVLEHSNTEKTTEKPLANARNSVSSKPNKSEKIRETLNLSGDQDQSPGTVKKELKANSIDSTMIKWLMNRCRDLQKRQDEDIAKVLGPVQHDFLTQIEVAEDETIKLLKMNHQASRIKLGNAQEAYLAALQTKFLQSNLQSFLARLQQANNKTSRIKRNRGISEP
ncbi:hypothetical protein ACHAPG_000943 [Botrytis cinerea]